MDSRTIVRCANQRGREPDVTSEVVIVGAGLAGSSAAIVLARAGRDVVLLERESQPQHKVCGEFLSQEALASLHSLGVEPADCGALQVHAVRVAGSRRVTMGTLPFSAMSLTRKRLDEELLQLARRCGVRVLRGLRVHNIEREAQLWSVKAEQNSFSTKTVFVATGKHDLTGRPRPAGSQPGLVGFKMYYKLAVEQAAALAGYIDLSLFRSGYGGMMVMEDGTANFCCLMRRGDVQRHGGQWESMMAAMQQDCPNLAERLAGAEPLLAKPLAVSSIPYGYLRDDASDGLWSLGDQAAVIPSFTGDGMSIALHSGQLAAAMYMEGKHAASFQRRLHEQLGRQVKLATVLSRGLVWAPSRVVFVAAVRRWPALIGFVAQQTRIAKAARLV
jgi:flavin-dependent dehydrogenase